MDVAGLVLGTVGLFCSIISTAYDIESAGRDAREIRTVLGRLNNGAENIKTKSSAGETIMSYCERLRQVCDNIPPTLATHGQERVDPMLSRRLGRILRDSESGWSDTGPLWEGCGRGLSLCQNRETPAQPVLWNLKDWFVNQAERILRTVRIRIPEMFESTSPQTLLLSWMMLALVLATFQGRHSRHERKVPILLCSVLAAVGLGFIEGLGSTSIVLTNIPWCLTFGILAGAAFSTTLSRLSGGIVYTGQPLREQDKKKQKKDIF